MTEKVVVAEHDYEGQDENQLSFNAGDRIVVTEEDESGWWTGRLEKNGKDGYFPETFVRELTQDELNTNKSPTRPPPPPIINTTNNNNNTNSFHPQKGKKRLDSSSLQASVTVSPSNNDTKPKKFSTGNGNRGAGMYN